MKEYELKHKSNSFINEVMIIQLLQKMNMIPKLKKFKYIQILLYKKSINKWEEMQVKKITINSNSYLL